MNYPIKSEYLLIFGKYEANIETYKNGVICIKIDNGGIYYKNSFYFYTINQAINKAKKEIKYLESVKDWMKSLNYILGNITVLDLPKKIFRQQLKLGMEAEKLKTFREYDTKLVYGVRRKDQKKYDLLVKKRKDLLEKYVKNKK